MATPSKPHTARLVPRHPIAVVMGHIDHGKSTLLDYIRKTNVVDKETGGITQHLSAYVVEHTKKDDGSIAHITFLDTPGHAAFQKMRLRGADVADIAILVVSAEEGVKPQTLEALASIKAANIPYIVAINKIDRPGANVERTKASLVENEIYVEGMGGDIPFVPISAKTGEGIPELLEVLLLASELAELTGDADAPANGVIIEADLDQKRGTSATLIIKNGTLKTGQFVVSGTSFAPVRIMESFAGKTIKEAGLSEPVRIVGWTKVPNVGDTFITVGSKKEAEVLILSPLKVPVATPAYDRSIPRIPLCIKADVLGTIEAIEHEIAKFSSDRIRVEIVSRGVGPITESDIKNIGATDKAIVVGFNVSVERQATDLAERLGVEIQTFDIIYKLAEWLTEALILRTPKLAVDQKTGEAKILKSFSVQKTTHVLGARVLEGSLSLNQTVKVLRRDIEIGKGVIKNLQQQKANVNTVSDGEYGMQLDTKAEIAPGDTIAAFETIIS
ncbi:GTP-binding protein [Patescibacteria group bacterium]|nr:GTP-binding protein [Patescibacteria group bacterium]